MNDTISKYDLMSVCTVSRETIDRLEVYAGLLEKWNSTINLVSKKYNKSNVEKALFRFSTTMATYT